MKINLIVARSKNNVIGKDNKLIWNLKSDLAFFKQKTTNNCVIMGRKTFESIGKKLDNRINIVLSRSIQEPYVKDDVFFCKTGEDISKLLEQLNFKGDTFIIGGGELYDKVIDKVDSMYITEIDKEYEGDTYFPEFDKSKFKEVLLDDGKEGDVSFRFVRYDRIK